jgi:lipopolysaccharide transport system permease protein
MASSQQEIVIEAGRMERHYWRDLWTYRELFAFLAWRDILVRYKQTVIGVAWSVLRPVLTMVVFTVVFGRIAKLPSDGVPYPVLVFSAMLPWHFFASAVSEGSNSLIQNANIISKIYFPRLIVPASAVVVSFVDFLISLTLLAVLLAWYQLLPNPRVFLLPAFLVLAILVSMGLTLLLAAINVRYRDFRYVVPFLIQFGLLISPVGFSLSVISEQWRWLYSLNPMVGVIEGFRWSLLPDYALDPRALLSSVLISAIVLAVGVMYFRKTERSFADII